MTLRFLLTGSSTQTASCGQNNYILEKFGEPGSYLHHSSFQEFQKETGLHGSQTLLTSQQLGPAEQSDQVPCDNHGQAACERKATSQKEHKNAEWSKSKKFCFRAGKERAGRCLGRRSPKQLTPVCKEVPSRLFSAKGRSPQLPGTVTWEGTESSMQRKVLQAPQNCFCNCLSTTTLVPKH